MANIADTGRETGVETKFHSCFCRTQNFLDEFKEAYQRGMPPLKDIKYI